MPKKQKGRNAFYYFMLDWRRREEARGRNFADLKQVQEDPKCSDDWQNLSPEKKKDYENRAKQTKNAKNDMNKQTNIGESMFLVQLQESQLVLFKENMQLYIVDVISNALKNNTLKTTKFYFIHFNWFYIVEDKENRYVPAEYAIGEFSLANGIERYHHKLVHIKPELGYTWEAIETARLSHKISCELPQGEKNFSDMYRDLIEFLQPGKVDGKYPPLFAGQRVYRAVPSLLDQLSAAAECENEFLVYSIELLFTKLRNTVLSVCKNGNNNFQNFLMSDAVGENEFLKDKYAFESNIECDYHKILDGTSQYCSLSIIRQWAYTFCDYCCEWLDIKCIPGIHCPQSVKENDLTSSMMNMSLNTTRFYNVSSMNGVSEDHKMKVSERTFKEEQQRRKEAKPLQIIDHSKKIEQPVSASSTTFERPLRPPNTKSFAVAAGSSKQGEIPDLGDTNFPLIGGRGVVIKKKTGTRKLPVGRGMGGC